MFPTKSVDGMNQGGTPARLVDICKSLVWGGGRDGIPMSKVGAFLFSLKIIHEFRNSGWSLSALSK